MHRKQFFSILDTLLSTCTKRQGHSSPLPTKLSTPPCQTVFFALKYYQNVGAFVVPHQAVKPNDRLTGPFSVWTDCTKKERGFYYEEEITCYADDRRYGCKPGSLRRRLFYHRRRPERPTTTRAATTASGSCSVDVILKTTASEYWSYVKAGAEAYAKDNSDVKVEVKGATSETAYDEQQNMIETDLNSGAYDAFVIAPLQADLLRP